MTMREVKRCVRAASYCSQLEAESRAGPDCVTRLGQSSLIKLTYGRRLIPLAAAMAQKARPVFDTAF